jgi:putative hydrolase of the HAD superfamily
MAKDGPVKACLVDVWQTMLFGNFEERVRVLADYAGVDPDAWIASWLRNAVERDRGTISIADSFTQTLLACGAKPTPGLVADLMRMDEEGMREYVRLYDDTVPFLTSLRSQGILIAIVSNCSETTRPLLEHLGVIPLADAVILSCEVGSAKPAPDIYVTALADLGVAAADAVFIDDNHSFCVGAEAVGVRPIQIARPDVDRHFASPASSAFPIVATLLDAPRHF